MTPRLPERPARSSAPTSPLRLRRLGGERPRMLGVVCVLVLLEATLLVGVGIAFGAELARGTTVPGASVFLVVFMLAIAATLAASARGLWRGRRWSRSPVLTWQLLLVLLAFGWLGVEPTWWAGLVLVVAVIVGVGLVLPSVVAATTGRAPRRDAEALVDPGTAD